VSFPFVHDARFAELAVDEVMHPIDAYLRTNLITAKAVARHMTARRSGTILTLSAGASRVLPPGSLGYGTTADAAVFVASDRAGAITGAVVDLTCGNAVRTSAGTGWRARLGGRSRPEGLHVRWRPRAPD
jgi:3-oxoacyl-[acyl-carrier protein] reductase